MADLVLKQIERGSVSFTTTSTSQPITLTTTLTDTTKTILIFGVRCDSSSPINFAVSGRVSSTTQIVFERAATPSVACTVEYQVIEFTGGIKVEHKYFNQSTATVNTTITEVVLANTFVMVNYKSIGSGFGANDMFTAELTSTTNLQTVASSTDASVYIAAQIISIDNASVQAISQSYGTGQTSDVTLGTNIDPAKTFWVFSLTVNSTVNMDNLPYLSYVSANTLRFTRAVSSGGLNFSIKGYVVSLSSGVTVQNVATTIASGTASISPTISPTITVANTALLQSGIYSYFASSNINNDEGGYACFTLSGLATNAFTATRAASPSVSATTNVQVLSFETATAPSTQVFLIYDF